MATVDWIDISDKIPDDSTPRLVWLSDGKQSVAFYTRGFWYYDTTRILLRATVLYYADLPENTP